MFFKAYRLEIYANEIRNKVFIPAENAIIYNAVAGEPSALIEFSYGGDNLPTPNSANMTIYGLGEKTREILRKDNSTIDYDNMKHVNIKLFLGYDKILYPTLDLEVYEGFSKQNEKGEWVTQLTLHEAVYDIPNAVTNANANAGDDLGSIVQKMVSTFKTVTTGTISNQPNYVTRSKTLYGNTHQLLKGVDGYTITNGKVYVLKENECLDNSSIQVLSADSGLKSVSQQENKITCETILRPDLRVNQYIELISRQQPQCNGAYRVASIRGGGSSGNGDYASTIELYYNEKLNILNDNGGVVGTA